MSLNAFIDESARGARYVVCAALIDDASVDDVRRAMRRHRLPRQRRVHFKTESDPRRRKILARMSRLHSVRALVHLARAGPVPASRDQCLTHLVADLCDRSGSRLTIECSDPAQDERDRRLLYDTLRKIGGSLEHMHVHPHQKPALWISDGVAWAYGARGEWRDH